MLSLYTVTGTHITIPCTHHFSGRNRGGLRRQPARHGNTQSVSFDSESHAFSAESIKSARASVHICGCLSFIGSHPMCDGTYAAHTEGGGGAGRPGEGTRPGIGIDRRVTRDSQQSIAAGVIGRRYYARMTLVCVCACARYTCSYGCACI